MQVYQIADYLGINDLQAHTVSRLKIKARKLWMSQGFIDCIPEVYACTVWDKCDLRKVVIDTIHEHLADLWKMPLKDLLREGGDFPVELMDRLAVSERDSL